MQASMKLRTIKMSPRKMRAVANVVRGRNVEQALATLDAMPKKAAKIIAKAVRSAASNADDLHGDDVNFETLHINRITIDGGPITKRWMPRSMGRANRVNHRTSHLSVVVSDEV